MPDYTGCEGKCAHFWKAQTAAQFFYYVIPTVFLTGILSNSKRGDKNCNRHQFDFDHSVLIKP